MAWPVTLLRRAFVGASVVWFGALPAATFVSSQPSLSSSPYLFAFTTYLVGSLLCHQRPERSFFLWGSQMPVCARCTGIYFGAALAALVSSARRGGPACPPRAGDGDRVEPRADTQVGPYGARAWLIVAVVPTIATLVYEWISGVTPANWIRAAAGIPIGVVVAWIVVRLTRSAARDEVN